MASTQAKAERKALALGRIAAGLGIEQADLHAQGRGDAEMALVVTLERVADALEASKPVPAANIEKQLEAETGRDFTKTGSKPPTFVETDNPAPEAPAVPKRKVTR